MRKPEAKRLVKVIWEPRGGDAPCGWSNESYTVQIGSIKIHTFPDTCKSEAYKLANLLTDSIQKFIDDGEEQ